MVCYRDIADRCFEKDEDAWFRPPDVFTGGQNLHAKFLFARDFQGGTEIGNGVKYAWLLGLPEFAFLLDHASRFSFDVLFKVDFQYLKDTYGLLYLDFWNMDKFPEDYLGIIYPSHKTAADERPACLFEQYENVNLKEFQRFNRLTQEVRRLFQDIGGFSFPEDDLGATLDDDILVIGDFPLDTYALSFSGKNLERFREIIDMSDYFGVSAVIFDRSFELSLHFGVYNVRF